MSCHCTYLEPAFWHDVTPCVMHSKASVTEARALREWLLKNKVLESHVFFQTSGTTGQAKWVALSKNALLHSARAVNDHLGVELGAKWGLALPIYHVGGFGVIVRSFLSGGHCQVYHQKWDAAGFTKFVYENGCEHISLVPTQVSDLVTHRCICPDNVKTVVVGGGQLTDDLYEKIQGLGWRVFRSYGMTEAASQIATGDIGNGYLKVLPIWNTRLGTDGLLEFSGEASISSYVQQNGHNFIIEEPKREGWFTTQDRVELSDGKLKMLGRSDSLVKILGELVDLAQLEKKIKDGTGKECLVFAEPDERRGVKLIAVVESETPIKLDQFRGLEKIERVEIQSTFPRTPLGKIARKKLYVGVLGNL